MADVNELAKLYDSLSPEQYDLLPFPPEDDRGEKQGDELLAEAIFYGDQQRPDRQDERSILFAIKLGRALAIKEMTSG